MCDSGRADAAATRTASPIAPPICLAVFISPDAAPASLWATPVVTGLRDAYAQLNARLADIISRESEAGVITTTAERPEHVAGRLVAFVEGLAYHVLNGTHPADVARRQVLDAVDALYR